MLSFKLSLKNKHPNSRKKNNFGTKFGKIRLELPQIQLSPTAWMCWEYKCNYCKFVQTDLLRYLANLTYSTFCVHIADGNSKLTWQSDCVMWLLCLEVVRGQQSLGLGSVGFLLNYVGYFFLHVNSAEAIPNSNLPFGTLTLFCFVTGCRLCPYSVRA